MRTYNLNQLQQLHSKLYVKLIHTPIYKAEDSGQRIHYTSEFKSLQNRYLNVGNIIIRTREHGLKRNWFIRLLKWLKRL